MTYEDFKIQFLQLMNEQSLPANQLVLDCLSNSNNMEGFGTCVQGKLSATEYVACKLVMALVQQRMAEESTLEADFSNLFYEAALFLSEHNLIDSTVVEECDAEKCGAYNNCPYNRHLLKSAYRGIRFAYAKDPKKDCYTYFVNPNVGFKGSADSHVLGTTFKNQQVTVHENHDSGLLLQGDEWSMAGAGSWKCNLFVMDSLYLAMKTFFHLNDTQMNDLFVKQSLVREKSQYYFNVSPLHGKFASKKTFFRSVSMEKAGKGCIVFFFEADLSAGHIEVLKEGPKLDKTTGYYTFQGMGAHCNTTCVRPSSLVRNESSKNVKDSILYELSDDHSYTYAAFYKVDATLLKKAVKGMI